MLEVDFLGCPSTRLLGDRVRHCREETPELHSEAELEHDTAMTNMRQMCCNQERLGALARKIQREREKY